MGWHRWVDRISAFSKLDQALGQVGPGGRKSTLLCPKATQAPYMLYGGVYGHV